MSFDLRKATQRKFNADMRFVNRVIENDDLWQGRFVVRQKKSSWNLFNDGSGGILFVIADFYDKKLRSIPLICMRNLRASLLISV